MLNNHNLSYRILKNELICSFSLLNILKYSIIIFKLDNHSSESGQGG